MKAMRKSVDTWFFWISITLAAVGAFIFLSASLGLLAREGPEFSAVVASQFTSIFLGAAALFFTSRMHYRVWKQYSFYIFLASLLLSLAVFLPVIGFEHGGADRWILIGPFSLQPAEFLKIGFVMYFAAWLSRYRRRTDTARYGLIPFIVILGAVAAVLLAQPDMGTFFVILGAALAMYIAAGAAWRHVAAIIAASAASIAVLAVLRPYVKERLLTFLNPALDPQGAGWQITQSLIAIGSGEVFGRGFGQSIQKFGFLPEPTSDSIFAVYAEEFGFVGSAALIILFILFAMRGLSVAKRAPDHFSRLLVLGIVILITGQALLNIGSMISVLPLSGLPLPFVGHGGTAMVATLAAVGIVFNVSRYCKSNRN